MEEYEEKGYFKMETVKYSFLESIPAGIDKGVNTLTGYVKQMKKIFNPSTGAYKGVGGFAAIGGLFPDSWNWPAFWSATAFISIILAFMNILPIPALDGGHVMFLLYEMITGRKPSDKFLEYAQMTGFFLEHLTVNQRVLGSSPRGGAKQKENLVGNDRVFLCARVLGREACPERDTSQALHGACRNEGSKIKILIRDDKDFLF